MNIRVPTETLDDRIAALCAGQPPDHSLRQAFYNDPEIFEADIERLFLRHWLCAGHESLAPNPGDYFLYEMANGVDHHHPRAGPAIARARQRLPASRLAHLPEELRPGERAGVSLSRLGL